jgi:hypothetical protein
MKVVKEGVHTVAKFSASAHATHAHRTGPSHSFAGLLAGLLHPSGELGFVEPAVLVDIEVAHFLLLGLAGRTQRRVAGESHLDVLCDAMDAEEPVLAFDAIERRVPLDCLVNVGDGAPDERFEGQPHLSHYEYGADEYQPPPLVALSGLIDN